LIVLLVYLRRRDRVVDRDVLTDEERSRAQALLQEGGK